MRKQPALVLAAFSVVVVLLAAGLRPDAFYVGDPGVKLTAARNALHSPAHPLDIPLPRLGDTPAPHLEGFFAVHGDHAHAVTSEAFPLLSAPLLGVFGLRGLYVLPALGFLATLAGCAWLGRALDATRNTTLVVTAAGLGTPFLFYGLEFWEHAPALGLGAMGAAWLVDDLARPAPGRSRWRRLGAGALLGASMTLRPEASCFVVAIVLALPLLPGRPSRATLVPVAAGAVMAMAPVEAYTLLHFGSSTPTHISVNAELLGDGWLVERWRIASRWLLPSLWTTAGPRNAASFWGTATASVTALAGLAAGARRPGSAFLWAVASVTAALVVLLAPNDGGGQWGPRYLLFAYLPLTVLAADGLMVPRLRRAAVVIGTLLLLASIWVQRAAYRELRGTKAMYGRVVDFVDRTTTPEGYVVTDVWWLDQIAAASLDRRTLLFAPDAQTGRNIVRRLSDLTVPSIVVVRSRDESTSTDGWTGDSCYFEERRDELPVRGLVAIALRHRCGYRPEQAP